MIDFSFVIPCYKSVDTIQGVVNEICNTMELNQIVSFEIILVNDNSPDNLMIVLRNISKDNNKVTVIDLTKNYGQHSALMAGFEYINGQYIICLDDDGQTPANEVMSLIKKSDDYDVVFASYINKKHSFFRNLGSKINDYMAYQLIDKPKDLQLTSFFIAKRYIIEEVKKYKNPFPYMSGLLLRTTKSITNVNVTHRNRLVGNSGYTFKKLLSLWINGFTAFSIKPLRIATTVGFITSITGFFYGIYTIIRKLIDSSIILGYSSLMAVLLFLGGVILIVLGLIGEYVGRIYLCINNSPQFVIRETINAKKE